mmetsp:Transcript_20375/g.65624  ORF Transcript_20375/g.65624 Transcript_20375/m.65624 type:complete len:283 (+) Transcript_20375:404-1252(+)
MSSTPTLGVSSRGRGGGAEDREESSSINCEEIRLAPASTRSSANTTQNAMSEPALAEVRALPKNAQLRLELAVALEAEGDAKRAYAEAKYATQLVPTYGKAHRFLKSLDVVDDWEQLVTTRVDDDVVEDEVEAVDVAATKTFGNELMAKQDYDGAIVAYTKAIEGAAAQEDPKLLSNRAAAYLKTKQNVRAAADARASIALDADFWKPHWYLGQALLATLKASTKGACTANGERAQEALRAFDKCLQSPTLPNDKRGAVQELKDRSQTLIFEMTQNEDCLVM